MWSIKLYWFKEDSNPAQSPYDSEIKAREYAAARSAQVQGKCEVLRGDNVVDTYVGGHGALTA